MIDTDFKDFNPNKNNWLYFYFIRDERYKNNREKSYTIEEAEELFDKLAKIITQTDCNIYKEVKDISIFTSHVECVAVLQLKQDM